MAITSYESVCIYDYNNRKNNGEVILDNTLVLVIQTDDYSVGVCRVSSDCCVELINTKHISASESCIDDIEVSFREFSKGNMSFFDCVLPFLECFNRNMRLYYRSEKQMDHGFNDVLHLDYTCSDFENVFNKSKLKIRELLSLTTEMLHSINVEVDDCSIAIVGKAALLYPIVHYIKEDLSFDPFLTDDRYVNDSYPDSPDKIIEIGTKEYLIQKQKEREVVLCTYENQKRCKRKMVVSDTAEEISYLGPYFVAENERLEFIINSKARKVELPYSIAPLDCDLIEVGGYLKNEQLTIRFRRFNQPTKIYDISLK